jgi:nickel-dependent lactate racemase
MDEAANKEDGGHSRPSVFCALGSENAIISDETVNEVIRSFLESVGSRQDVLLVPPDFTRYHSQAGTITQMICHHYGFTGTNGTNGTGSGATNHANETVVPTITILPALGTHAPMTNDEIRKMFGNELAEMDPSPIRIHDWRNDVVTIGEAPAAMVAAATNGLVEHKPWPAQLNQLVWQKRKSLHDPSEQKDPSLVLSIGQVVPHEVMGMANYNKNLFVGTGGVDAINLSHFIGAVYGMEKMMGRADNPLRSILNYSSKAFLEKELDLWYILTVIGRDGTKGNTVIRGLFIGNDIECYQKACELSLLVNFSIVEKPLQRVVAYLNPEEFHSTWLGNKSIYRTRMAMADGGILIVLAPGLERFGEDDVVDGLIRKYGYVGTPAIMELMRQHQELQENLSVVAHLIHVSDGTGGLSVDCDDQTAISQQL